MEYNAENKSIRVHGRESIAIAFEVEGVDDLEDHALFLEIPAIKLRMPLETGETPSQRIIFVSRSNVAKLPDIPVDYIILDETNEEFARLVQEGAIIRYGHKADPSQI